MSTKKVTIYLKPACTTCKKAVAILDENNVDYESVDYYKQAVSEKELTELIKKLNIDPNQLLRKRAGVYKELGLENKNLGTSEVVKLVLKHPDLLQRPIVACGDEVIVARPAENIINLIQ